MMIRISDLAPDQRDAWLQSRRYRADLDTRDYILRVDVSVTDTSAAARRARSPYDDDRDALPRDHYAGSGA